MSGAVEVVPIYSEAGETTAYIVYKVGSTDAVFVDPVPLTRELYEILLERKLTIATVLITHVEAYMARPLATLAKIFHFEIFAAINSAFGMRCRTLGELETISTCNLSVTGIRALSHSRESCMFVIDELLFSGSIVQAGTLGETPNGFAEELLVATVKDYLFAGGASRLLLPSVGPPSTLAIEQRLTPFYSDSFIAAEDG